MGLGKAVGARMLVLADQNTSRGCQMYWPRRRERGKMAFCSCSHSTHDVSKSKSSKEQRAQREKMLENEQEAWGKEVVLVGAMLTGLCALGKVKSSLQKMVDNAG